MVDEIIEGLIDLAKEIAVVVLDQQFDPARYVSDRSYLLRAAGRSVRVVTRGACRPAGSDVSCAVALAAAIIIRAQARYVP